MRRVDPDNPSSIRSLARLAGNPNNKPAARNDHTAQPGAEPTLNRFALKPLALGPGLSELQGYVPLIIQLHTYQSMVASRRSNDFLDFLDYLYAAESLGIPKLELLQFMNYGGKALFLLDGLDEITEVEFRQAVSSQIAALADEYPQIRILVTSRIIGYAGTNLERAGFAHFVLEELDDERIAEFVSHQYELVGPGSSGEAGALSRRTLDAIRSSPVLRQLAGNPLLLTILSAIGLDRPLSGSWWQLYEQSATALLERWDVNRYLSEQDVGAAFLGIEDKKQLLRLLAYKMQENGGNYISSQDFLIITEDYLSIMFELDPATAREIARTMIQQFRERDFILVWHSITQVGFIHRSFLEYFCASAVIERFRSRELGRQDLQKLALDHRQDPSWTQVLAFVSEVLGERLLAYEMGEVFKPVGTPTLTFVEPREFSRFLMTLRQSGLGIVIEGPSGIGKTTFIRQAERREREHGVEIRILSARRPQDLTAIAALPSGHTGTIVVDDFHRLQPTVREAVSDYLKLLADEESENRLIIIGIPGIGKNLVELSFDLATRVSIFRLSKAPPESVRVLIERGEESLNIAFYDRDSIVAEANGSLQTAQMLCWHIAQQDGVERTQVQRKVLGTPVVNVIQQVDAQLSTKYDHTMRQFLLLDSKRGQVLPELLRLLSRTDDGILALDSVKQVRPDLATGIDQHLLDAFPEGFGSSHPQLERDLYLDPVTQRLIAEDPQFLFYLRHKPFDQLVRMSTKKPVTRNQIFISYSHRDQEGYAKLSLKK